MALLSYVMILPRDLLNPFGPLSSQLTSVVITEPKAKTRHKRRPYLKLDDGMRANVHICIHRLEVQPQYLVPGESEKSRMLHPLLPRLKLACLAKNNPLYGTAVTILQIDILHIACKMFTTNCYIAIQMWLLLSQ